MNRFFLTVVPILLIILLFNPVNSPFNDWINKSPEEKANEKIASAKQSVCHTTGYILKNQYFANTNKLSKSLTCKFKNNNESYTGEMTVSGYISHRPSDETIYYEADVSYDQIKGVVKVHSVEFSDDLQIYKLKLRGF